MYTGHPATVVECRLPKQRPLWQSSSRSKGFKTDAAPVPRTAWAGPGLPRGIACHALFRDRPEHTNRGQIDVPVSSPQPNSPSSRRFTADSMPQSVTRITAPRDRHSEATEEPLRFAALELWGWGIGTRIRQTPKARQCLRKLFICSTSWRFGSSASITNTSLALCHCPSC